MRKHCGSYVEPCPSALRRRYARATTPSYRGRRAILAATVLVAAFAFPAAAAADPRAFVPQNLRDAARAHPDRAFNVIVQGERDETTAEVAAEVADIRDDFPGKARGLKRKFRSLRGVAAQLTGRQVRRLAARRDIFAVTRDSRVILTAAYSNSQLWPTVAGVNEFWNGGPGGRTPAIAIIDSGIQASRPDFGGRVVRQVVQTTLRENSPGDGRGHGTFVAGIAAGAADGKAGANVRAPIISIDVMDDSGMALTSDVIAAADWILVNKANYNIRVANFSLHSAAAGSFMFDPLNKAVERLWFRGVVVVAAAGNYAVDGAESGVRFAPANDPFVITVGASDIKETVAPEDDVAAPWSAYGPTLDGFAKPELGAPGRYMIGPVPTTATMPIEHPERVVESGYMWMSGTSFSAPVVSGIAALLLARHPDWGPDQVKGALMLTARATSTGGYSLGVGEVDAASADLVSSPPNPNLALNQFIVADAKGRKSFDAASWAATAQDDASWAAASWGAASWSAASWSTASWSTASWAAASWSTASWAAASWGAASWGAASWGAASWSAASWGAASWVS
jgi:serine protease AprX